MKRAIGILLVPLLLLASWSSMSTIRGDVSGDGRIDLGDAILATRGISSLAQHTAQQENGTHKFRTTLNQAIIALKVVAEEKTSELSSEAEKQQTQSQIETVYLVQHFNPDILAATQLMAPTHLATLNTSTKKPLLPPPRTT